MTYKTTEMILSQGMIEEFKDDENHEDIDVKQIREEEENEN